MVETEIKSPARASRSQSALPPRRRWRSHLIGELTRSRLRAKVALILGMLLAGLVVATHLLDRVVV
jgi:hypothetical protein